MRAASVFFIGVLSAAANAQVVLDSFDISQQIPHYYPFTSTVSHPLLGRRSFGGTYYNGWYETASSTYGVTDTPSGSSGVLSFQYNSVNGVAAYASYWSTTGATVNLSGDSSFAFTLGKVQGTNFVGLLIHNSNGTTLYDSKTIDISNSYSSFNLRFSDFTGTSIVPFQWDKIDEIDLQVGNYGGQSVTEFNYFGAAAAAAVPEPSTVAALTFGALGLLLRRKRRCQS